MAKKLNYGDLYTLRKDGLYMGYYRDRNGKRHSVYDRDPEKLHKKIEALEAPAPPTFRDIADAWQDWTWPRIRAGTQASYKPALCRALDRFGDRVASEITPTEIFRHLERMREQDYSAQSIKVQRLVYNLIFRHAVIDQDFGLDVRANPAADVPMPSGVKRPTKRQAPEEDVVAVIRRSAGDDFGLFPLFLLSTGMRRGEALAIQWQDVDFKRGEIRVEKQLSYESGRAEITRTKTSAGVRSVPILPDLRAVLARPAAAGPQDYVFPGPTPNTPLASKTLQRRWKRYCEAHNLNVTPHVLRHAYATMLFEAGVDVYTAQRLLGHTKIETTMAIYTHLREKKKNESIEKLNAHVLKEMGS